MTPPDNLRRALLDASLGLITAEGLEKFSMREVARRAGVSHQAPYHHFLDREAILAALVAEGFELLRQHSLAALVGLDDAAARLTALGQAYVAFALDKPAHFKLMFRSELVREDRHPEAQACAKGAYEVLLSVAREIAQRTGRSEEVVALAGWSLVHGLATLLLEGKLDKAMSATRPTADAVVQSFESFWRTPL